MRTSPSVLDAFAPIGLGELDARTALQDRVDVKYVVDARQFEGLLAGLAPTHRALDIDGRRLFAYETVYFDTPDLRCLRDHVQGRRQRWKARRRRYLDSGHAALELKVKGRRGRTVKHALAGDARDGLSEVELAFLEQALESSYGHALPVEPLTPSLTVSVHRLTLAAPELGERVTCDVTLDFGGPRLRDETVIVECKSPSGISAGGRVLRALGARPVGGMSKYCVGMALTRSDVRTNELLPLVRRHFDASPSAQSPLPDSNRRPLPYHGSALPAELRGHGLTA